MRATLLAARRALPERRRRRFDAAIAAALAPLVRGRVVAGYVPMAGEPGGPDLLDALTSAQRLLLPVLRPDGDLDWAGYAGALVPARHGLREPVGPRLGIAAVLSADVVVVPALAVDRRGRRLGRGGGSYDRVLTRVPTGSSVAVVYPTEVLPDLPTEGHDRPVGGAVTPDGVWWAAP